MARPIPLLLLATALVAVPASADLYRCAEEDGSVRYADRPEGCRDARPVAPRRRIQRMSDPALPSGSPPAQALDAILLSSGEVAGEWEVVEERSGDPRQDPDLVAWGVRDVRARHYTRGDLDGNQVCSVELWRFATEEQARRAHRELARDGWRFDRRGTIVSMLRGRTWSRAEGSRWHVFPACRSLGDRILRRAEATLGRPRER